MEFSPNLPPPGTPFQAMFTPMLAKPCATKKMHAMSNHNVVHSSVGTTFQISPQRTVEGASGSMACAHVEEKPFRAFLPSNMSLEPQVWHATSVACHCGVPMSYLLVERHNTHQHQPPLGVTCSVVQPNLVFRSFGTKIFQVFHNTSNCATRASTWRITRQLQGAGFS